MMLQTYKHEDKRRLLVEWIKDLPVRCLKTIYVKDKSLLGKHYHNNKDKVFYLAKGKGIYLTQSVQPNARIDRGWLFEGDCLYVQRGVAHSFELFPGSILLEAATEPYNEKDEIPFEISFTE